MRSELFQSNRKIVKPLRSNRRKYFTKSFGYWFNNTGETLKSIFSCLNQSGTPAHIFPALQHGIAGIRLSIDEPADCVAQACPQRFRFLEVTEQNLPCHSPAGTNRFFQRVHQLSKSFYFLGSSKSLLTDFRCFISIVPQGIDKNIRRHPLILQTIVEILRGVDCLVHSGTLIILR